MSVARLFLCSVSLLGSASAVAFVPSNTASVKAALQVGAENLMGYYNLGQVGVLPSPYYWWQAGNLFTSMINYWHYTGDATYNTPVAQGILSQTSSSNDFMMPACEGNDDEGWWAHAAMTAAEYGFPSPSGAPSWLSLAQNTFNDFESRWDTTTCNGGMKWQIQPGSSGYNYKASIANGLAFQLAARLARYTGDQTYSQWADMVFNWTQSVGLIDDNYNVYDGTDDTTGCTSVDHDQWSYNVGAFMYGAAVMFDVTGDSLWSDRTAGLLGSTVSVFFDNKIMFEQMCEQTSTCNVDQLSFKAYLSRWMVDTAVLIPSFQGAILPFLNASAIGAAEACTGGSNGQMCGSKWYTGSFDGLSGFGQQLSALEIMHSAMVPYATKPGTAAKKVKKSFVA